MVFCPTTGDDVSRSLFDWAYRSLFTRARPIDSVLQVWLTRADPHPHSCARFLIVNWANGAPERLIRVKAGRKMPKNLWNYMHLSVLQGKTSLLQIVIHLFLLLFHRVYFLFCWPFQLNLSFKTLFTIRFWPCYLSSVFCIHVLVHLNTLVPLPLHCPCLPATTVTLTVLCAWPNTARIDNGRRLWSAHTQYIHAYVDNGRRLWSQDYAYASLISHCKQNAMRCQICKIS